MATQCLTRDKWKDSLHHFVDGKRAEGPCTGLRGDCTGLWGDCTGLRGICTGLRGICTGLWDICTGLRGDCTSGLSGDCSGLWGDCTGLRGDCTGLRGDCTGLRGDCTGLRGICTGLRGDCTDLRGDYTDLSGICTYLSGNCSGLWGDCTGLSGNLDEAKLSKAERKAGVCFFFKQWGEWAPAEAYERESDRHALVMPDSEVDYPADGRNDREAALHLDSNEGCAAMARVAHKRAGRRLDGRTWDALPWKVER